MRNPFWLVVAVLVLAAAFLGWRISQQADAPDTAQTAPVLAEPAAEPAAALLQSPLQVPQEQPEETEEPADEVWPEEPLVEQWQPDPAAVESLRQSRLQGDPRAPPIARPEPGREREMPTEEELADPDLYLEYEMRQQQKVYASFVDASTKKIADLKAIIERGREEGVSPEQLAEGEEKLRRLEEMRAKLIAENPDIQAQASDAGGEEDGADDAADDAP